jgi:hypothetical protein
MTRKVLSVFLLATAFPLYAADPATFSINLSTVTVDGVAVGSLWTPNMRGNALRNAVAYDTQSGQYHLWMVIGDSDVVATEHENMQIGAGNILHAVSADGIAFSSQGLLIFAVSNPFPGPYGASLEPPITFLRAERVGAEWKLIAWHYNDYQNSPNPSRWGQFNYNTSVFTLGTSPSNRAVLQQGPLTASSGTGPGGFHVGAFGIVEGKVYLKVDTAAGGLARFDYSDAQPPQTSSWPSSDELDLFTGTGQTSTTAYAHNSGKVLRELDGRIGAYYTLRDIGTGARLGQRIWRIREPESGGVWTAPELVYPEGTSFLLDGIAVPPANGFSGPDLVRGTNACRLYFNVLNAAGEFVLVAADATGPISGSGNACFIPDAVFSDGFE